MDVDQNEFLDNSSEDTGDDVKPQKVKKELTKEQRQARFEGQSNTIRIAPVPRNASESTVYDFIMTVIDNEPVSISMSLPKKRVSGDRHNALYDAQQAYIVLATKEDAVKCAHELTRTQFAGYECQVSVTAPSKHCTSTLKNKTNWITISNLNRKVTEQNVLSHIQKHGKITNKPKTMYLFQHPNKDDFAGFAYVECANAKDATKCVSNLRNTSLKGDKLWCKFRPNRRDLERKQEEYEGKTRQIILGNLHYSMLQNDVMELCAKYGQVEHVAIWHNKEGYPLGSASVTMANTQDAQSVFEGLQGEKVQNLKLITAYTKIGSAKKKVINKLTGKNKNLSGKNKDLKKELKREVVKNKYITKKLEKTASKLRNNASRAQKAASKGRRDGVGSGSQQKNNNRGTAFGKRTGGRSKGRGGRGRSGPKFA